MLQEQTTRFTSPYYLDHERPRIPPPLFAEVVLRFMFSWHYMRGILSIMGCYISDCDYSVRRGAPEILEAGEVLDTYNLPARVFKERAGVFGAMLERRRV